MLLAIMAFIIVLSSFWYSNYLVKRIAIDEKQKAKFWAEAVQNRANLIKFTNDLFKKIKTEERKKAVLYAEATKQLSNISSNTDYNFALKVLQDNTTVPVILLNDNGQMTPRNLDSLKITDTSYLHKQLALMKLKYAPVEINYYKNFKSYLYYNDSKLFSDIQLVFDNLIKSFETSINNAEVKVIFTNSKRTQIIAKSNKIKQNQIDHPAQLEKTLLEMEAENTPILIDLGQGETNLIFYSESELLTILKYYPYVQFGVIGFFLLIAYILFSTARKAEQDQVWVGMSKETAHQLGTPLSSLMAWNEYLLSIGVEPEIISEMQQDVKRLITITDRFSKIGSQPTLSNENVNEVLQESVEYLKKRTSRNVYYELKLPDEILQTNLSRPLFEWVIENLCKNAVDAMDGKGKIVVEMWGVPEGLIINIIDSGKGIPKSKFETIFEPGFTTKSRGWGLGLSLCKRIVETYHKGKIYVFNSELNRGTTFRIELKRD